MPAVKPHHGIRRCLMLLLTAGLLLSAGCYVSQYTLGPVDHAKVNQAYVGDWSFKQDDGKTRTLVVRDFDARRYYVEWDEQGKPPIRMAGFITPVNGVDFAQLRNLDSQGKQSWLIVRVGVKDGKLELRQLEKSFFDGRTISSGDDLRAIIEKNLDNPAMYEKQSEIGSRVKSAP